MSPKKPNVGLQIRITISNGVLMDYKSNWNQTKLSYFEDRLDACITTELGNLYDLLGS